MTDKTRYTELLRALNVERRVESHLKVSLVILVEDTQETLLEDGGGKRVGQDDGTVCRVGH